MTLAASLPSAVLACRGDQDAIIRHQLPKADPGQIVAEVEVISEDYSKGFRWDAKILSMIQGDYSGTRMVITPAGMSSCDQFPRIGDRGFIVGQVLDATDEALVVDPVRYRPVED